MCEIMEKYEKIAAEAGREEGRAEAQRERRLNAIRDMIELGLTKVQILTKYSKEEYDEAEKTLLAKA